MRNKAVRYSRRSKKDSLCHPMKQMFSSYSRTASPLNAIKRLFTRKDFRRSFSMVTVHVHSPCQIAWLCNCRNVSALFSEYFIVLTLIEGDEIHHCYIWRLYTLPQKKYK